MTGHAVTALATGLCYHAQLRQCSTDIIQSQGFGHPAGAAKHAMQVASKGQGEGQGPTLSPNRVY